MNTRDLTEIESEKVKILNDFNIPYSLLFITDTGLTKNILDATVPIANLLKEQGVHNFELQEYGPDHRVMFPALILSGEQREETKVSLYRANRRGDMRFWPGRFKNYAADDQVFALFVADNNIVLLNLSPEEPLEIGDGSFFSEILETNSSHQLLGTEIGILEEETEVEDGTSSEIETPSRFEVSSYGWDSDVEGLVKRLNRKDIKLPGFQRGFVWSPTEQSRFIESLILGLPVPNIFLAKDNESKTLNIIDGQQRLKTLQRYLAGDFAISSSKKIYEDLRGCYFSREVAKSLKSKVLEDADARTLADSILHSIVIHPDASSDSPDYGFEYNNAVIQIFRRLNTSGKALQPQEVRSCIFYGSLDVLLHSLNDNPSWRDLFGVKHSRYKDVEAILRFFALYEQFESYKAPMPSFLDKYMEENRNINIEKEQELTRIFESVMTRLLDACSDSLFKTGSTLLLSKFDAVTVGFAKALASGKTFDDQEINSKVEMLLADDEYVVSTAEFINDTGNVVNRINAAIRIFEG